MNDNPQLVFTLATLLAALGMWLLLPRVAARGRWIGAVLMAAALGLWASQAPRLGYWVADSVFLILAGVTVVAAVGTIASRNPLYSAMWFGLTLLGTAGLFLLTGAQFLAVATVLVYAGAILVTFLFVLMLAQPEGRAAYDRTSWEALVSAATGAVIVGILSMTIACVLGAPPESGRPGIAAVAEAAGDRRANVLQGQHVARLGTELFGRHLIAVEVAGILLLAALVGAAVIVAQSETESGTECGAESQTDREP